MTINISIKWQQTPTFEHTADDFWDDKLQQHISIIDKPTLSTFIKRYSDNEKHVCYYW